LVQCDAAQSGAEFRACVEQTLAWRLPSGGAEGLHCGLALSTARGACFRVSYDQELRSYRLFAQPEHPEFVVAKQNLGLIWRLDPVCRYPPQQSSAPVEVLPGGPHAPILVAIRGHYSSAGGVFETAVIRCMS